MNKIRKIQEFQKTLERGKTIRIKKKDNNRQC